MGRRRFTREFKIEAVRRVLDGDCTIESVAREVGISGGLLGRWKKELESDAAEAFPGNGRLKDSDELIRRLERENRELKQEVSFLKKLLPTSLETITAVRGDFITSGEIPFEDHVQGTGSITKRVLRSSGQAAEPAL